MGFEGCRRNLLKNADTHLTWSFSSASLSSWGGLAKEELKTFLLVLGQLLMDKYNRYRSRTSDLSLRFEVMVQLSSYLTLSVNSNAAHRSGQQTMQRSKMQFPGTLILPAMHTKRKSFQYLWQVLLFILPIVSFHPRGLILLLLYFHIEGTMVCVSRML